MSSLEGVRTQGSPPGRRTFTCFDSNPAWSCVSFNDKISCGERHIARLRPAARNTRNRALWSLGKMKRSMRLKSLILATAFCALSWSAANGAGIRYTAELTGPGEVPPNTTTGTGKATATLDTAAKTLRYSVTYSGLTGPAVAAHFHGPASPGQNAPPVITIKSLPSPMKGEATLTDSQISDLQAGMWYFKIHTAAHPMGEIRGQVTKVP